MALRPLALAAILAALSLGVHAQTSPEDHAAHHPDRASAPAAAAPARRAPAPAAAASASAAGAMGMMGQPAGMEQHMKAMREMHEKMGKARTPKEREALMAEHMKLMQEGMAMMDGMKGMGGTAPQGAAAPASAAPAARMQALEQRMDMMQSMMQMMMDRMPAPATKP
ncbi:hypothetical protein [Azohydromonas australica]|uniref:hypothetical protein n=1 Tax=Azohydromonas australica TaxID=364039 RepID=UPI0003FA6F7A|nr:hypothetical protein [Azohydromonas australica]